MNPVFRVTFRRDFQNINNHDLNKQLLKVILEIKKSSSQLQIKKLKKIQNKIQD